MGKKNLIPSPLIWYVHVTVIAFRMASKDISRKKGKKMPICSSYHTINASEWIIPFFTTTISRVLLKKFGYFTVQRNTQ